jgi:hypothetical protein
VLSSSQFPCNNDNNGEERQYFVSIYDAKTKNGPSNILWLLSAWEAIELVTILIKT